MTKLIAMLVSSVLGLGAAGMLSPEPPQRRDDDGPPKKKGEGGKKGEPGPPGKGDELRKAYDLLRRIKADGDGAARPEDRLRDWTGRAARLYRKGVEAAKDGDPRRAHEFGLAAHDLARAVDHARNASRYDRPDPDLPPPHDGRGPDDRGPGRRELRKAYDRIRDMDDDGRDAADGKFYLDAARDLYNAARRDAEADRPERAGELARAAEAMTHVPEHLARAEERDRGPEPKGKHGRPEPKEKKGRPEPKGERERPEDDDSLPPPLPR